MPFALGVFPVIWQILFFYIPLLCVIAFSFILGSFSLDFSAFYSLLSPLYAYVMMRSVVLAFSTAVACGLAGYPLAYYLAFVADKWKNLLLFLLIIPFWTNFLLHVFAWIFILDRNGVINTLLLNIGIISQPLHLINNLFAISIMMFYSYLPFMVLPLYVALDRFNVQLCDASLDLGATWWQTMRHVIIPLSFPGIVWGFFLVFVPAYGEFAIPELMGGDKVMFAGSVVTHYILGAHTESIGAAFTILSSIVLLAVSILVLYGMRRILKV